MQLWDREEGETSKAYEWFGNYLAMGDRSLAKVAKNYSKPTSYVRQLSTWSTDNNWVERAAAYDAYIDAEARKKSEADLIERRAKVLERDWTMHNRGYDLIEKMLKLPLTTQRVTKERLDDDGRVIAEEITVEPAHWNLNTTRLLMETASKLGRNAVGLVTDTTRHELTGKDGETLQTGAFLDLSALDDTELEQFHTLYAKATRAQHRAGEVEPEVS